MIIQVLHCPHCQGTDVVRHGKTRQGKQRYRCREKRCVGHTFLLDYTSLGQAPEVKRQIIEMAGAACQWHSRYRSCLAREHQHGHERTQKN